MKVQVTALFCSFRYFFLFVVIGGMGEKKDNSCPPVLHRWLCTFCLSFKKK
ncbi:hypothetical protein Barb4_00042 [Bacteroidales bacterium Barb4]|nr:hypothetical protein Barb4_00042 [Bacteroidales bacterium Barb4]